MTTVAQSCRSFLNSLGVNIHASQGYSTDYASLINILGVTCVRDFLLPGGSSYWTTLHSACGARLNALIPVDTTSATNASITQAAGLGSVLLSIEMPNEPNNFLVTYNGTVAGGTNSWDAIGSFCVDACTAAATSLPGVPIFSTSEVGAQAVDNTGLQWLTIPTGTTGTAFPVGTQFATVANCHNYAIGNGSLYTDNQATNAADRTLNDRWDGLFGNFHLTFANHYVGYTTTQLQTIPAVTTETGWDTVVSPGGEWVQGVVMTNVYLAQFLAGWSYTFIYELVDGEGGGQNFGIFHGSPGLSPKPLANFIQNMTTILADPSVKPSLGSLNYSISGAASTTHSLLLQKASGVFELCVWGESASQTPNAVTVNLGQAFPLARVYDITVGSYPQATYFNASAISVTLTDHALILELIQSPGLSANSFMVLP